jgi:hypothetical protein
LVLLQINLPAGSVAYPVVTVQSNEVFGRSVTVVGIKNDYLDAATAYIDIFGFFAKVNGFNNIQGGVFRDGDNLLLGFCDWKNWTERQNKNVQYCSSINAAVRLLEYPNLYKSPLFEHTTKAMRAYEFLYKLIFDVQFLYVRCFFFSVAIMIFIKRILK